MCRIPLIRHLAGAQSRQVDCEGSSQTHLLLAGLWPKRCIKLKLPLPRSRGIVDTHQAIQGHADAAGAAGCVGGCCGALGALACWPDAAHDTDVAPQHLQTVAKQARAS
jgi:hypothetical protein